MKDIDSMEINILPLIARLNVTLETWEKFVELCRKHDQSVEDYLEIAIEDEICNVVMDPRILVNR